MSDEPTERDVEDLALVVGSANPRTGHVYVDGNDACKAAARAVLASNWYAERMAEAYSEGYEAARPQVPGMTTTVPLADLLARVPDGVGIDMPGPEGGWAVAVIDGRVYRARVAPVERAEES